jgi:hypothetical protein
MRFRSAGFAILLYAVAFGFTGCSSGGEGDHAAPDSGGIRPVTAHGSPADGKMAQGSTPALKFSPPPGWISEAPTSSMRQAQYKLPKTDGDQEDAELVVFYFQGGGGGVQANIDRWVGQFAKPGGGPVNDAKTSHETVHGIPVTIVEVNGTYVGGMGSSDTKPKTDFRMLAAVAEAGSGPWFFKLTGPAKTVSHWEPSFKSFLDSIQ